MIEIFLSVIIGACIIACLTYLFGKWPVASIVCTLVAVILLICYFLGAAVMRI